MAYIMQKMIDCDVMVLASPVYFYSIDAQLKAVIDRSVCRWTEVKNKEMYYIMTAADGEKESMDTTLACFRGYADCVEGAVEKIRVQERKVAYCTACYACRDTGNCAIKDDMAEIMEKMNLWILLWHALEDMQTVWRVQ